MWYIHLNVFTFETNWEKNPKISSNLIDGWNCSLRPLSSNLVYIAAYRNSNIVESSDDGSNTQKVHSFLFGFFFDNVPFTILAYLNVQKHSGHMLPVHILSDVCKSIKVKCLKMITNMVSVCKKYIVFI